VTSDDLLFSKPQYHYDKIRGVSLIPLKGKELPFVEQKHAACPMLGLSCYALIHNIFTEHSLCASLGPRHGIQK
jgi:hypothetical protein